MSRSCCGDKGLNRRPYRPFERRRKPWWPIAVVALIIVAGVLTAYTQLTPQGAQSNLASGQAVAAAPAAPAQGANAEGVVQAQDGVLRLPVTDLVGNQARFYTYQSGEKSISFFVLRSSDGVIRAAFDACDVCFEAHKGYRQEGDVLICNNCGTRFPSSQINEVQGGCNPAPINRDVQDGTISIKVTDLEAGLKFF